MEAKIVTLICITLVSLRALKVIENMYFSKLQNNEKNEEDDNEDK